MTKLQEIQIDKLGDKLKVNYEYETVPIQTESYSRKMQCYSNVREKIEKYGGSIHYGWSVHVTEGIIIEAERHAVWENEERNLICVTPHPSGQSELIFFSDNTPVDPQLQVDNVRMNITGNKIVNDWIYLSNNVGHIYIAIKEGIVAPKFYPFAGEKEKIRIGSGNKIGLTISEVEKIEALAFEEYSSIWHTHNIWLISFYFAGIRISDVVKLRWSDYKDNRLYYIMNKNEKPLSLKIPDKAQEILTLYEKDKKNNNGYIFPFLIGTDSKNAEDIFRKTRNATKLCNKYLKRIALQCNIEKNLSNHIARHSFGNIAGDRIHPLMLQKLYRHSDLKTTLNYQANFIHRDADEALDNVINF